MNSRVIVNTNGGIRTWHRLRYLHMAAWTAVFEHKRRVSAYEDDDLSPLMDESLGFFLTGSPPRTTEHMEHTR
jgi:hypothetical protein